MSSSNNDPTQLGFDLNLRPVRHYTPIWDAIKASFISKSSGAAEELVKVEVHKNQMKNLIRMVQKEKWQDDYWGLSSYTKLQTASVKDSDSGYVIVEFKLVPHNKAAIFSQLLAKVNPEFQVTASKAKEFKFRKD